MAFYILNEDFEKDILVDDHESLIWTERFSSVGDFELLIASTPANRLRFVKGVYLGLDDSTRVMQVDTIENTRDEEGQKMLTITGPSYENVLALRVGMSGLVDIEETPKWVLEGTPAEIARYIFKHICVDGSMSDKDILPKFATGSYYSPGTVPESDDEIVREFDPGDILTMIQEICEEFELGFRLYLNPDTMKLNFDIYSGDDRTSAQSSVPAVIFSEALDNLKNVTEIQSDKNLKNVAYVFGKNGSTIVYANDDATNLDGDARRVMVVIDQDIEETNPTLLEEALQAKGKEELAKQKSVYAFDGEVTQFSQYTANVHYFLGDMVEVRNDDGAAKNMRVSELIFVSDKEGIRTYPTLTDILLITPGTWLSWDYNEDWIDADGYWADA